MGDFRRKLGELEEFLEGRTGDLIIGGDFNAKAPEWLHGSTTDSRGREIVDVISRLDLIVINDGETTTLRRDGCEETTPDITLATQNMVALTETWRELEGEYTGSDHEYLIMSMPGMGDRGNKMAQPKPIGWNVKKLDKPLLVETLKQGEQQLNKMSQGGRTAGAIAKNTMRLITRACNVAMPKKKPWQGKESAYWWNDDIREKRKKCHSLRRKKQRAKKKGQDTCEHAEHLKVARRALKGAIGLSKRARWRELEDDIDANPWGLGWKVVMKKLHSFAQKPPLKAELMEKIVRELFPTHEMEQEAKERVERQDIPLFTVQELGDAVNSIKTGKAPGPDGVPAEILKVISKECPDILLRMYNKLLVDGTFYKRWKIARLMLISKGKGIATESSAWRPLCLLDTVGKLFERLLKPRLIKAVDDAGGLSPHQHGFRQGKSTIHAIREITDEFNRNQGKNHRSRRVGMVITLDVRNAFNSLRWKTLLDKLRGKIPGYLLNILKDYLSDRFLEFDTEEGKRRAKLSAGAAQGSVLGPVLWNIYYDQILRIPMPEGCYLVAYADDLVIVIYGNDMEECRRKLKVIIRSIIDEMADHSLELAIQKTEVIFLTTARVEHGELSPVSIAGTQVEVKEQIKYLGVILDPKLAFNAHLDRAAARAGERVTALSRIMANVRGPRASKRRLMMSVADAIVLYGAEVWADVLRHETYRKKIARVQRKGALRICSAYRTVSEQAVQVIAGVIPIDLQARERKGIWEHREGVDLAQLKNSLREETLEEWKRRWRNTEKCLWTRTLIPDVVAWASRGHGEVNYYLTMFLSGHGYYRSFLCNIGKVDSDICVHCGKERDTPRHTFFACDKWTPRRRAVEAEIGPVTPESVVALMLNDPKKWAVVNEWVTDLLKTKKAEEDKLLIQAPQ